jgi:hypothetical protein
MPTFIPARGRTLHLAGVCVNRIGTQSSSSTAFAMASTSQIISDLRALPRQEFLHDRYRASNIAH